jgi:HSP20 family molecular chaperone IbpA
VAVAEDRASATYERGVLEVTLPKQGDAPSRRHRIEVQSG